MQINRNQYLPDHVFFKAWTHILSDVGVLIVYAQNTDSKSSSKPKTTMNAVGIIAQTCGVRN